MLLVNFLIIFSIASAIIGVWYYFENKKYIECTYYKITKNPLYFTFFNLGIRGEYLTYEDLKEFETYGAKFLFNTYIPKQNGGTTEIDIMLITIKGIFVLESKNYSGWIYGSEHQEKWCQTIKPDKGKIQKYFFYNPIKQNNAHLHHLKTIIGENIPLYSIIVFSNRCTLKKLEIKNPGVRVINRSEVASTIYETYNTVNNLITTEQVQALYDQLFPYTQVSTETKEKHVAEIAALKEPSADQIEEQKENADT